MKLIKVGAGVLNQIPLAWKSNQQNIIDAIEDAKKQNISILCLPEMCITGYGCEDAFFSPNTHRQAIESLFNIAKVCQNIVVSVGMPLLFQNKVFNVAGVIANGEVLGFVAKKFLAGEGIHYEPRWFMAWKKDERALVSINNTEYRLGDYYFNIGGVKIGFEICEDAWVADRPGRDLYQYGLDIILNPSASHFAFQKIEIRKRFVIEGSRAFNVSYIYANLLGNEAGRAIYDGGAMIASGGNLVAIGNRFSFADYTITSSLIDIDISRLAQSQSRVPFEKADDYSAMIKADFSYPNDLINEKTTYTEANWEKSPFIKEEEFARAVSLSLFDYMRKSHSNGFVVSLSGGADSSAICSLIYLMVKLAIEDIGLAKFKSKLNYFKVLQDKNSLEGIMPHLLTTAYQSTKNSSDITFQAASELASAIHATFYNLSVDTLFNNYVEIIGKAIGRELNWQQDDLTLQNIQARVRAPSIWMLANINNALLLSTSNRSEAAVGYATMDGDTSGGLSPIAGIDKNYLRSWLRWLENNGVDNRIKIEDLKYINQQAPTAELRPKENKQTDEDDLMPYDLLDDIEEAAIRDKKNPSECVVTLRIKYKQYSVLQLKTWTERFFKLWSRNQWKRERYAPSFHLDDENLDPKTWCRFPILSGGFVKELEEMWLFEIE